jgi:hypothetical protein
MDKDWTRPLKDELDRPVEACKRDSEGDYLVRLKGVALKRIYLPDFSPWSRHHYRVVDYPQGTLRYAGEPDADGWYRYRPTVDGVGPEGVSVETHEIGYCFEGEWRKIVNRTAWHPEYRYRYRPLSDALTTLTEADLTARIEAGEAAKAELDRREQAGKADEQAFREALADVFEAIPFANVGSRIRRGGDIDLMAAFMARFTLKDKPDA